MIDDQENMGGPDLEQLAADNENDYGIPLEQDTYAAMDKARV